MTDETTRSGEACPVCGEHRLALIEFPRIPIVGYQAYSELIGMGETHASTAPGIGCLACGTEWDDLAAFREARRGAGAGGA